MSYEATDFPLKMLSGAALLGISKNSLKQEKTIYFWKGAKQKSKPHRGLLSLETSLLDPLAGRVAPLGRVVLLHPGVHLLVGPLVTCRTLGLLGGCRLLGYDVLHLRLLAPGTCGWYKCCLNQQQSWRKSWTYFGLKKKITYDVKF